MLQVSFSYQLEWAESLLPHTRGIQARSLEGARQAGLETRPTMGANAYLMGSELYAKSAWHGPGVAIVAIVPGRGLG